MLQRACFLPLLAAVWLPVGVARGQGEIVAGAADGAGTWYSITTNYQALRQADTVINIGRQGDGYHQAAVFPFQLPNLGAVAAPFQTAEFRFRFSSTNSSIAGFNIDLYALPARSSSTLLPVSASATNKGDFFMGGLNGAPADDNTPGVVKLQDNLLTAAIPAGTHVTTSFEAGLALRNFLNGAYSNGAGAGKWVFLRLSADAVPASGSSRYVVSTADHATATNHPRIRYNFELELPRPFIWVREAEKSAILGKIASQAWATSLFNALRSRTATNLAGHQADRDAFIRTLPVDWHLSPARYRTIPAYSESSVRNITESRFNTALDCAVLYYLTGSNAYAALAADILHNTVKTLLPVAPSTDTGNGGWIFQDDLLKEARVTGTQLPLIYDFLFGWLYQNQVYDVQTGGLTDFDHAGAQQVFRTFYELCRDHGQTDNNWSALMATCMLNNLLALNDDAERTAALNVYLATGGTRQDPLAKDYLAYSQPGNVWPESLQYANEVCNIRSTHMVLVERYDPARDLFGAYPNLPLSLPRVSELVFPNGQLIRFGDGQRTGGTPPYFIYELVYQHALARGRTNLTSYLGPLIAGGIQSNQYSRGSLPDYEPLGMHNELLGLLWNAPQIGEPASSPVLPRTDRLPFAGITIQRNPAPGGAGSRGLMAFVGGAGHVHSHASGMNMELYGLNHVLGAKGGRSDYGSTLHENYYRLFAAHNTVIVNGGSRGSGGWQDIEINTVQNVAMEPQPSAAAVSPDHSFSVSSFLDDKGTLAEATQQRALAVVRTGSLSGFYVDFFRSKSTVSNRVAVTLNGSVTNQYHDYIYRNVGDLNFELLANGSPAQLFSQTNRFQNDIGDAYQQPGWRYFENTEVTPPSNRSLRARFSATISSLERCMTVHMPAVATREFARVRSPPIADAPSPYTTSKSPTLVVRQIGSAWDRPFAAVYEPHFGAASGTVQQVTHLERTGVVVGVKVESIISGAPVTYYVISNPEAGQTYMDAATGLSFTGRFGIVADRGNGNIVLYLGDGKSIAYRGRSLATTSSTTQAEARFAPYTAPTVTANTAVAAIQQPPAVGAIPDQIHTPGSPVPPLPVTVSDAFLPPSALTVTASSTDTGLFPPGSLAVTGTGSVRTLTINPAPGIYREATIAVQADNGYAIGGTTFQIVVDSATIVQAKLQSLASDASIRDDTGAVDGATDTTGLLGTSGADPWVDRCLVFVFQIPDFGPVTNPFTQAGFSFNYVTNVNTPGPNDLYGLPTRASPSVVTSHYYGKTASLDTRSGTVRLQTSILNSTTPPGIVTTSETASQALVNHLNTAYAGGAGTGRHVFLRLNTTTAKTGVKRAIIHFSEGGTAGPPDTRPHIAYTARIPIGPPTLTTPEHITQPVGQPVPPIAVTLGDAFVPASSLTLQAASTNHALLPDNAIQITGGGATRTLQLTPQSNTLGATTITLTAGNGSQTAQASFNLTITGDDAQRWRFHHFGTTAATGPAAPSANPDTDAYDNAAEYILGTDPNIPDTQPLLRLLVTNATAALQFSARNAEGPGYENRARHYTIQHSTNLLYWPTLPGAEDIPGNGQTLTLAPSITNPPALFRLGIWLTP